MPNIIRMEGMAQQDLFGGSLSPADREGSSSKFAFLERIRFPLRLDHVVIGLILLLILNVVVFSLGVENGKQFAMDELISERAKREEISRELAKKVFKSSPAAPASVVTEVKIPKSSSATTQIELPQKDVVNVGGLRVRTETVDVSKDSDASAVKALNGRFTIQTVTYKSQADVERQIKRFANRGHQAFVIPSGKYLQVCIDAFESKGQARQLLSELKSKGMIPKDAYVRSIPAGVL